MIELGMAVGASVAWGASDFVAGLAARRRSMVIVLGGSLLTGLALMAASAAIAGSDVLPAPTAVALAAGAGLCEVGGFALLYKALASGPMSPVAPIAALGGLVPLTAHLVRGDAPGPAAVVGLVAALVGIGLVSWEPGGSADGDPGDRGIPMALSPPAPASAVAPGAVALAAGSAVAFGSFFLLLEEATLASGDPVAAVTVSRVFAVAVMLPLLLVTFRPHAPARGDLRDGLAIASVGVLDIGANTLYAVGADQAGSGSGLAVIASTYPVATVALAGVVLRERLTRLQACGAALTLVAVLLVGAV